ncbi:hypothetical protein CF344_17780 [Pseudomonas aeruginosa]|uniref:DUF262 domain-containing protein n=1 Tax=Pseudomonas aeruginosa TaxID=287 RepID=UPI000B9ADB34|nr:DUF262 domain-containing protein [Pseudomonas aeruginosa]OXT66074.1 hypothetical protein CF344_17780 [Pseudomonas aeruginosa]
MNKSVHTYVQTPATLCAADVALIIPSYQRPYVWPSEDVISLLEQIIAAYESDAPHYYIGTVLTSLVAQTSHSAARTTYEVIDGQQRMTTLTLLALSLSAVVPDSPVGHFNVLGNLPRLVFAIRDEVQSLLGGWVGLPEHTVPEPAVISRNPYLRHLAAARKTLADRIGALRGQEGEEYIAQIADYIFAKVKWVNNVMPRGMDLNRLFSTMNNSGVQLEQSDILKSRLLGKIVQHKARYDAIWQACENMDNYFERNLRQVFSKADWTRLKYDELAEFCAETFPLERTATQAGTGMSIAQLAKQPEPKADKEQGKQERHRYCRPIISFSLLLMHTYRIYLRNWNLEDVDVRLHEGRLNEYFNDFVATAGPKETKDFIECLWQVRYQFDRWVVKWLPEPESDNWHLRLTSVYRSQSDGEYRLSRTPQDASDLSQLQSVRNFTGERSAQYWLTPFLGELITSKPTTPARVQALLEDIDNELSLADVTQKEASFSLLCGESPIMRDIADVLSNLKEPGGTRFEHYWFQKLEYILWRKRDAFSFYDQHKLASYRVTSKNSVEHVHPQNEEFGRILDQELLDSFGNLVLLSPGENSSYSNQSVGKKQADFNDKPRYDSLKLAHMFNAKKAHDWDGPAIEQHQKAMLALIAEHYGAGEHITEMVRS